MEQIDHAVVIGGSVAGLAAAAALAPHAAHVTIVERHQPVGAGQSAVAQGRFAHVLLGGGAAALDRLVPGFSHDLIAHGAVDPAAHGRRCHWWAAGAVRRTVPDLGLTIPMCSRALVEGRLRHRVLALPNVSARYEAIVRGLRTIDRRVIGIEIERGDERDAIEADLVVDASGRGSRAATWIEEITGDAVPTSEVSVGVSYTGVDVELLPSDLERAVFTIVQNSPALARIGVALPAEGNRWKVVLGGYFGDAADPSQQGMDAFARSLPDPAIAELLQHRWLTEPARHRFPSSRRTHFERVRRLPHGFCAIGDAVASFNPIYGQGMSAAALQAEALGRCVERHGGGSRLQRAVAKATAAVVANPWQIATGADFIYEATAGHKPPMTDRINRYLAKVMFAAAHDEQVDVALARVQQLLAPPPSLFAPRTVRRVRQVARREGYSPLLATHHETAALAPA